MTIRLGVLVSGRGTNLQALLDACARGEPARAGGARLDARVVLVVANRAGIPALERAVRAGVPEQTFVAHDHGGREPAQRVMAEALVAARCELVVLAGFDQVLGDGFFVALGGVPVINVHPALLPAFGGAGMIGERVHAAVLASGARETGCTVHRVGPGPIDDGEILLQRRVPVLPGDDVASLAARVLTEEHAALVEAVRLFV